MSQWFSDLSECQNHQRLVKTQIAGLTLRIPELVGLGWDPQICISPKLPLHMVTVPSQTMSPLGPASRVCLHLAGSSGMWPELHKGMRCLWKWSQIWHLCSLRLQLTLRPHYSQNALPQAFLLLLFLLADSTFNKSGFSPLCLPMFNFSSLCANLNCAIYLVGINIL